MKSQDKAPGTSVYVPKAITISRDFVQCFLQKLEQTLCEMKYKLFVDLSFKHQCFTQSYF